MNICECGCGGLAKKRFIKGHKPHGERNPRWKGGCFNTEHYQIIKGEYQHRRLAEKALGYPLPFGVIIHHFDYKNDGIVICQDNSYHRLIHWREKALRDCGHADWRKCLYCHKYDEPLNLQSSGPSGGHYHKVCAAQYTREKRKNLNGS